MRVEVQKLLDQFNKYEQRIIIGLDFDDTIFPLADTALNQERCEKVVELIKEVQGIAHICLWTVADDAGLMYKKYIAESMGIRVDYVNDSPVKFGNSRKPYFNILLDDGAGLNESIDILTEFKDLVVK